MLKQITFLILLLVFVTGCSTTAKQTVKPLKSHDISQICIIENPDVAKQYFLEYYKAALERKGVSVKVINEGSKLSACEITSTYTARWAWDMKLYLTIAQFKLYKNGDKIAEAEYRLVYVGFFDKYIDIEKKVNQLVDQMLPGK